MTTQERGYYRSVTLNRRVNKWRNLSLLKSRAIDNNHESSNASISSEYRSNACGFKGASELFLQASKNISYHIKSFLKDSAYSNAS